MVKWEKHEDLPDMWLEPKTEDKYFKEERFAFSPITANTFSIDNMALLLLVAKYSTTLEDRKMLKDIIIQYLKTAGGILESIQKSSSQNWLTALNNQHIAAAMLHRIGLIDDGGYLKIVDHFRSVFDKMFIPIILSETLGPVTTLIQGSSYEAGEKGVSGEGIGALATMLKALM